MKLVQSIFLFSSLLLSCSLFSQISVEWEKGSYVISHKKISSQKAPSLTNEKKINSMTADPFLEYFGGIRSPMVEGEELQSSDVFWDHSRSQAFSAYNFRGALKKGAIQLIKLEFDEVFVNSEIIFADSDINSIHMAGDTLYFAGTDEKGAFTSSVIVREEKFIKLGGKVYLPGYVATDVFQIRDRVLVTTGDNGGLNSIYKGMNKKDWTYNIYDARSVYTSTYDRMIYVLSGQPAKIYHLNRNGQLFDVVEINGATIPESKSSLIKDGDHFYATVGELGTKVVCEKNVIGHINAVEIPGFSDDKTVTTGVDTYGDLVFTSNGEAGLYMYRKSTSPSQTNAANCDNVTFTELDHFHYRTDMSANHVATSGYYVFVASGSMGVQVFRVRN